MEQLQEELKAHLMATSDEFRELVARHTDYDRRLEQLEAMSHLSDDEQINGKACYSLLDCKCFLL